MKKLFAAVAAVVFSGAIALAANIPLFTGPFDPSNQLAHFNNLILQLNSLITPQTMAPYTLSRNILDNGGMQIQQRGTGTRTCGTTTIPSSAYSADRWGCNVNVTSGAGTLQVDTTTADLPAQPVFNAAMKFYRTSGTLAQPQCVMQEITSARITPLQGQPLTLSVYIKGMALMLAEQTTVNAYLFTGTGADQGLQSFTASPAITPAFTGIASTLTTAFTITSSWARYTTTWTLPGTATEAVLALCWTPTTGGTAGATDGFLFTGAQLEVGNAASSFEYRSTSEELGLAQRFFIRYNEIDTAGAIQFGGGTALGTTTTCSIVIPFPVTMFKAPVYANALSATTFTVTSASQAATALGTPFSATLGANGVNDASINFTTTGMTAKDNCEITSTAAGAGVLDFSADF